GTDLGSPWLGVNVIVPLRVSLPSFTTATPMSAPPPDAAVPPAQYQVDDRAPAGGATGMAPAVARTVALGRPKLWSTKPAATTTSDQWPDASDTSTSLPLGTAPV